MREVVFSWYDEQLRPGTIMADFRDGNSNHQFQRRYELDEAEQIGRHVIEWFNEGREVS